MSYKSNYVIGVGTIAVLSFFLWLALPSNIPGSPIPRVAVILFVGLVTWTFIDAFLVTVSKAQKQFGKLSYNQAKAMGGWTGGVLKAVIQERLFDTTEGKKYGSDLVFLISAVLVLVISASFGAVLAPVLNGALLMALVFVILFLPVLLYDNFSPGAKKLLKSVEARYDEPISLERPKRASKP